MLVQSQADVRALRAWRILRRLRRLRRRLPRAFETVAACIPAAVLLLHLLMRSSGVLSERETNGKIVLPKDPKLKQHTNLPLGLVVVPEPNTAALAVLGLGAIWYRRQGRRNDGRIVTQPKLPPQ